MTCNNNLLPGKEDLRKFLEGFDASGVPGLAAITGQFKDRTVVIYGAGCYGVAIRQTFCTYGIQVKAFLDIKAQPGDTLLGIPVYRADDQLIDAAIKHKSVVVVALVKDHATRTEVFGFIKRCGFDEIVDAQSIRCHSVRFDNKPDSDTIWEHVQKQSADILKCFDLFSDAHSREIYHANVTAHIAREYDNCPESIGSLQYFPNDIVLSRGYARFIDCGGYIGDTVVQLMECKSKIEAVAVFEPNLENFSRLSFCMDAFSLRIPELYLWPCAVSDKTEVQLMDYVGGSSTLNSEDMNNCVQCVSLDDVLKNFAPTFLKMDVEGEEYRTIAGAEKNIRRYRPDLAVCVYHCINHLWDIALLIDSWGLGYQFYLRAHNSFTMETVLYATVCHPERELT